jgi:hypothetical protein
LAEFGGTAIDVAANEIRVVPFKIRRGSDAAREYDVAKPRSETLDLLLDLLEPVLI